MYFFKQPKNMKHYNSTQYCYNFKVIKKNNVSSLKGLFVSVPLNSHTGEQHQYLTKCLIDILRGYNTIASTTDFKNKTY